MAIGTSPNYNIEYAWMSLIRTRFMLMRYIYTHDGDEGTCKNFTDGSAYSNFLDEWTSNHDEDT